MLQTWRESPQYVAGLQWVLIIITASRQNAKVFRANFGSIRAPNITKHVCVAARIGDGKAPAEANTQCIRKTSNEASADSGCNPSGWHEFWPMALSKVPCLE